MKDKTIHKKLDREKIDKFLDEYEKTMPSQAQIFQESVSSGLEVPLWLSSAFAKVEGAIDVDDAQTAIQEALGIVCRLAFQNITLAQATIAYKPMIAKDVNHTLQWKEAGNKRLNPLPIRNAEIVKKMRERIEKRGKRKIPTDDTIRKDLALEYNLTLRRIYTITEEFNKK